jgi:hypothetical protein
MPLARRQQKKQSRDLARMFDALVDGDRGAASALGSALGAPQQDTRSLASMFDELVESKREPGWTEWAFRNFGGGTPIEGMVGEALGVPPEYAHREGVVRSEFKRGAAQTAGLLARTPRNVVRRSVDVLELLGVSEKLRNELRALGEAAVQGATAVGSALGDYSAALPSDPRYAESLLGDTARAGGSAAVFAGPSMLAGPAAPYVGSALGIAAESTALGEEAEAAGAGAGKRVLMSAAGIPIGAIEGIGVEKVLGRLGAAIGKTMGRRAVDELGEMVTERILSQALKKSGKEGFKAGATEGVEELLQGIGEDLATKLIIDPEKRIEIGRTLLDEGLPATIVGTVLGGGASFGADAMQASQQARAEAEAQMQKAAQQMRPEDAERFRDLAAAVELKSAAPIKFAEQLTPEEGALREFGRRLGIDVAFFDGGSQAIPAAHAKGRVLLSRSAGKADRARALLYHESIHGLRRLWALKARRLEGVYEKLEAAAKELLGEQWQESGSLYVADLHAMGQKVDAAGLTPEGTPISEEATARLFERLAPLLDVALRVPRGTELLAQAIVAEPSLAEALLDSLKRLLNLIPGIQLQTSTEQRLAELEAQLKTKGYDTRIPIRAAIQLALLYKETLDEIASEVDAALTSKTSEKATGDAAQGEPASGELAAAVEGAEGAVRRFQDLKPEEQSVARRELLAMGFEERQIEGMEADDAFDAIEWGQGLKQTEAKRREALDREGREQGQAVRAEGDYEAESNRARGEAWKRYREMRKATAPKVAGEPRPRLAPAAQRSPFLVARIEDAEERAESVPAAVHPLFYASADELNRMQAVMFMAERQAARAAFRGQTEPWIDHYLDLKRKARDYNNPERGKASTELRRLEAQLSPERLAALESARSKRAPGLPFSAEEILDAQQVRRERGFGRGGEAGFKDIGVGPQFAVAPAVGSDSFKAWFKESKAVDAQGKPRVLYHGTTSHFTVFVPRLGGSDAIDGIGFWFAEEPPLAYAVLRLRAGEFRRELQRQLGDVPRGSAIMPVYLSIQKPFEIPDRHAFEIHLVTWAASLVGKYPDLRRPLQQGNYIATYAMLNHGDRQTRAEIGTAVREALKREGYDGIYLRDDLGFGGAWIALESSQVKSATGNRGYFSPNLSDIQLARERQMEFASNRAPDLSPMGFYSQLRRTVDAKMPARASVAQVLGILKGGSVKEDELEWSGIREWLQMQSRPSSRTGREPEALRAWLTNKNNPMSTELRKHVGELLDAGSVDNALAMANTQGFEEFLQTRADAKHVVTKEQVLKFVDQNGVRLSESIGMQDEIVLRAAREYDSQVNTAQQDAYESQGALRQEITRTRAMSEGDGWGFSLQSRGELRRSLGTFSGEGFAGLRAAILRVIDSLDRLDLLVAERGTRLKEIADREDAFAVRYKDHALPGGENYREYLLHLKPRETLSYEDFADLARVERPDVTEGEIREWYQKPAHSPLNIPTGAFTYGHFAQPNVLVHVRTTDRRDAEGRTVLFLEEVQSDWHKHLRIGSARAPVDFWLVRDVQTGRVVGGARHQNEAEELQEKRGEGRTVLEYRPRYQGLPPAPFAGDAWAALALKRMLLVAVKDGYDAIGWTAGSHQIKRYHLRKDIIEVTWEPDDAADPGGRGTLKALDSDGEDVIDQTLSSFDKAEIERLVGHDFARDLDREFDRTEWESEFDRDSAWQNEKERYEVVRLDDDRAHGIDLHDSWFKNDDDPEEIEEWLESHWVVTQDGDYIGEPFYDSRGEAEREVERYIEGAVEQEERDYEPDGETSVSVEGYSEGVGGEWTEKLYDGVIRNHANKIGRKFGVEARVVRYPSIERAQDNEDVGGDGAWVMPLNGALRASALGDGFAQFAVQQHAFPGFGVAEHAGDVTPFGFYSQLTRTMEAKMPPRATVQQVVALLKTPGVKDAEIGWTGIVEWLDGLARERDPRTGADLVRDFVKLETKRRKLTPEQVALVPDLLEGADPRGPAVYAAWRALGMDPESADVAAWAMDQRRNAAKVTRDEVLGFLRGKGVRIDETVRIENVEVPDGHAMQRMRDLIREARRRELRTAEEHLIVTGRDLDGFLEASGLGMYWRASEYGGWRVSQLATSPLRHWLRENEEAIVAQGGGTLVLQAARAQLDALERAELLDNIDTDEQARTVTPEPTEEPPEPARYARYMLPGGVNYREFFLRVEPKDAMPLEDARVMLGASAETTERGLRKQLSKVSHFPTGHFLAEGGTHISDIDVLADVLTKERVDRLGRKLFHIEEVQSDWVRILRARGGAALPEPFYEIRDVRSGKLIDGTAIETRAEELVNEWGATNVQMRRVDRSKLPAPPFETNEAWVALALKRMVLVAVKEGYDHMSWSSGAIIGDRYNLRKHFDSLEWEPKDPAVPLGAGTVTGRGRRGTVHHNLDELTLAEISEVVGAEVGSRLIELVERTEFAESSFDEDSEREYYAEQYSVELLETVWDNLDSRSQRALWRQDHEGPVPEGEPERDEDGEWLNANDGEAWEELERWVADVYVVMRENELAIDATHDTMGRAQRTERELIDSDVESAESNYEPDGETSVTLEGLDLEVGGEWTANLYDRVVVKAMEKIGKPFGATVGKTDIPETEHKLWMMSLPAALKESALNEGFAQFAVAPRPDPDQLRRVDEARGVAAAEGEGTEVGSRPNPIANTSAEPDERAFQRGAREVWSEGHDPISRQQQLDRARAELDADFEGEKKRLFAMVRRGESPQAHEQLELDLIKQRDVERFLAGDQADEQAFADAVEASWAYQDARRAAGRALGVIRDAYIGMRSGRQRLADMVTELSQDLRRRIMRLREERKKPTISQERVAQIDAEIKRLLGVEARRVHKARRKLVEAGLNPKFIAADYFKNPLTYSRIARIVSAAKSGRWDWFIEYRLASMLSFPLTHVRNITGNAVNTFASQHLQRLGEALVNTVVREKNATTAGELGEFYGSWLPGLMQAGRNFALSMQTELPIYEWELQSRGLDLEGFGTKIDALHGPAIPGAIGRALRFPSLTLLTAADEFFKTLAAWTEGHALAYRQATNEGLKGDQRRARIEEILDGPPSEVHLRALVTAKELTFQGKPGPLTQSLLRLRRAVDDHTPGQFPLASVLFPFVQTPLRIFEAAVGLPGHPLATIWRALGGRYTGPNADTPQMVKDFARDGVGLALVAAALALVLGDDDDELPRITGVAANREERELMYRTAPELSVKVGDAYYSYAQVEPAATSVGLLVSAAREFKTAMAQGKIDAAMAALARLGKSVLPMAADKTFLETFGELYKIATEEGGLDSKAARFVTQTFLLPMVPNLIRGAARSSDEQLRANVVRKYDDQGTWTSAIRSLPYYSFPIAANAPPPRYDLWGRPIQRQGSTLLARILSPLPQSATVESVLDIDRLLVNYNRRVEQGLIEGPDAQKEFPRPPNYWFEYRGSTYYFTDEEYERLSREAGQSAADVLVRRGGRLNVEEPTADDIDLIKTQIRDARDRVRQQIIRDRRARGELR